MQRIIQDRFFDRSLNQWRNTDRCRLIDDSGIEAFFDPSDPHGFLRARKEIYLISIGAIKGSSFDNKDQF
jgi:hypothetical protein